LKCNTRKAITITTTITNYNLTSKYQNFQEAITTTSANTIKHNNNYDKIHTYKTKIKLRQKKLNTIKRKTAKNNKYKDKAFVFFALSSEIR